MRSVPICRGFAAAVLVLAACSEPNAPESVASVEISPVGSPLLFGPGGGQSIQLSATARAADGDALAGREIVWSVQSPGIVTVSSAGLVTAVAVGTATVRATSGGTTGTVAVVVEPVPVSSIDIMSAPLALFRTPLSVGGAQVVAVAYDSTGAVLAGRPLSWQSSNPLVASVDNLGRVSAIASGTAWVSAAANGRRDSVAVTVTQDDALPDGFDVSVIDALWTQASQTAEGTIPMLLGGRAAVVNVMTSSPSAFAVPGVFELRLFESDGTLRWSARRSVTIRAGSSTSVSPSVQFLVPAAQLAPNLQWEVLWDPDGDFVDASDATDRFPRDLRAPLAVVQPPTLKLRFVPISLTAHGGTTGVVTEANVEEYLRLIRQFGPIGGIQYSIGPAFASDASFGTPPSGGGSAFWLSVLQQLDIARVANPELADAHWVGVVQPPPGFNNTTFGGFGYIPSSGASFGPATRTFVLVNANWFNRESQTRELMMHELGHNLGRQHAPCGAAASPDPLFPVPGGRSGDGGHDTYSFQRGLTAEAVPVSSSNGDIMGYCTPVWISTYSYHEMLQFRGQAIVAVAEAPVRQPAIVVHGVADESGASTLHRAALLEAVASIAPDEGDWQLRLLSSDGALLATRRFALGRIDHLVGQRPISVAVPLNGLDIERVKRIEVRSPSGRTSEIAMPVDTP